MVYLKINRLHESEHFSLALYTASDAVAVPYAPHI